MVLRKISEEETERVSSLSHDEESSDAPSSEVHSIFLAARCRRSSSDGELCQLAAAEAVDGNPDSRGSKVA